MSRFYGSLNRAQKIFNRIEPLTVMLSYVVLLWCAYFAWVYPPAALIQVFGPIDIGIQATLFTLGGILSIGGHLSDRIFIEELGLIAGTVAIGLYSYGILEYIIVADRLTVLGEIFGVLVIAFLLMANRAFKIQQMLSAKWLKPRMKGIYEDS